MSFTVSLNPSYLCNLRCAGCYLTPAQLSDAARVAPSIVTERLAEISKLFDLTHVDIYGGEISVLPVQYQLDLIGAIRSVYSGTINVITNYVKVSPILQEPNVTTAVSYDFQHRQHHQTVYSNMQKSTIPIHVLVLATPEVIKNDVEWMIGQLNELPTVVSVEIKPYSTNQANQFSVSHLQYEAFIQKWITATTIKSFDFTNESTIRASVSGQHSSFSSNHVYVTPAGRYAVLDFDLNDNEFFKELADIGQYLAWCENERTKTFANSYCNTCKYLGQCLTEHIRHVSNVDNSCDGHYRLLEWYKQRG